MWLIQCRIFQTLLLGLIWKIIKFQLNISTFQRQPAEVKRRKWENYSSKHAVTWLGDFVLSSGSHCTTLIWGGDFCFINVLTLCVTQRGELSNKLGEIGAVLLCRHYVKWEKCNCLLDSEAFLICFKIIVLLALPDDFFVLILNISVLPFCLFKNRHWWVNLIIIWAEKNWNDNQIKCTKCRKSNFLAWQL